MTWPFVEQSVLLPRGVHVVLRMDRIVRLMGECGLDYRGHSENDLGRAITEAKLGLAVSREELAEFKAEYERALTASVSYSDYLRTCEWADVRYFALRQAGYSWPRCGRGRDLEVHHLTYERRGMELLADVTVLCVWCHADAHEGPRHELVLERAVGAWERRLGFRFIGTVLTREIASRSTGRGG